MQPSRDIARLIDIMAALRDPETGCAWDVRQDFASIAPYTIEEAHEVADAIARGDLEDLREELGDLLLQVVFHARIAEEQGGFDFGGVVEAITEKLIRRHPHVFGDVDSRDPEAIKRIWETIKQSEKAGRRARRGDDAPGLLDDVPGSLPALMHADTLTRRAAKVGFDWPDSAQVMAKVEEERAEVAQAMASGDKAAISEEIGDLLFAVTNLARHHGIDPEAALRATNVKFMRRFRAIEATLGKAGRSLEEADLAEMEAAWQAAKRVEKA
ncbi:nucleoside triphosphate pyrophosphohydrolase [Saliniramus sp.]|uniref:nucleoside triphosphate pyrophosphohydrolase n=1 Tax=Saliniramus sp. TaxID=2986772 RepID=UPI002CD513E7|nr:nucleoside triphosphate pyrophosphohydrolase [Saliniramus sp.]HMB10652.1 nucleoside triphosphate pyrophosphohydrolase [Saliniramus sp.]